MVLLPLRRVVTSSLPSIFSVALNIRNKLFVNVNSSGICRKMGSILSCYSSNYSVNSSNNDVSKGHTTMANEEIEVTLCDEHDIPDEGMKAFDVEGVENAKVLLVKSKGEISAIGAKCTHYLLPLEKGVLCNGKVRCPFHGACFNAKTGDIEDFPGLDNLPSFNVDVSNGKVKIKATRHQLTTNRVQKPLAKRNPNNNETFIVIGGGAAGNKCVETIRQEGFDGRVVLVSAESSLPYDRIKLSKNMSLTYDKILLRNQQYYEEGDIEMKLGVLAKQMNGETKELLLSNGETIHFDKAFIATGGSARKLNVSGSDLTNVFTLRNVKDGNSIASAAKNKNVVIAGTSFIGMEAASYLSQENRCASVTVVGTSSVPFERSLGTEIGKRIQSWFEEKGVNFQSSTNIAKILGWDGKITHVVLDNGDKIEAEVVVAGIGVTPSTDFLKDSGVHMDAKGLIPVNENMETNIPGIYCGGDVAHFPLRFQDNNLVNIGHWQLAHNHGNVAALNMLGKPTSVNTIPFFWTVLYGKSIRYAGYGEFDDIIMTGNLDELSFVAYYCKGDNVVAVASMNKDPAAAKFASHIRAGNILKKGRVLIDKEIIFKL